MEQKLLDLGLQHFNVELVARSDICAGYGFVWVENLLDAQKLLRAVECGL